MDSPFDSADLKTSLTREEMSSVMVRALLNSHLVSPDYTSLVFYNLTFIEERINRLKQVYPSLVLYAIAAKANPLTKILCRVRAKEAGLEVASLPELFLAEKAGFLPESIVFDSSCKTKEEIGYALRSGVYLNADSMDELGRIAGI